MGGFQPDTTYKSQSRDRCVNLKLTTQVVVCLPKMWDFDANMQSTAEGCECFKFWRRQVKVLVSYHQNRCSVFIPKDAKYILMNKLCGVLFDGRDADRVILVYANLCNNLLFGKSPRAFLCLDQLLQKLDFQTVYKVYTLHGFLSKNRKNCESCPVWL